MTEAKPPFQASLPGEKARQANPYKMFLMAAAGVAVFLTALTAQRVLFAGTDDGQTLETLAKAGTVEPLVVRDLPSYASMSERVEEEPEPKAVINPPTVDPEAEARRLAEKAALASPLAFERSESSRQPVGTGRATNGDRLASLTDRLQSLSVAGGGSLDQQPATDVSRDYAGVVLEKSYLPPASEHLLQAGTLIDASLITGVNSDLPGEIIAQVTEPMFDSRSGNTLLIPAGAKLLGQYDSVIGYGQDRAFIVWNRLLMPNGYSIELDQMAGTDKLGQAGVADRVDYHTLRLLRAILLSSFITVGANVVENSDNNGFTADVGDAAAQEALGVASRIIDRQLDVQPTITIRPGWTMLVLVNRDIILAPYDEL